MCAIGGNGDSVRHGGWGRRMEWVYGMWWGLGCLVGLAVPLLVVIVALLRGRRPVVAMLREWLDQK